MYIYILILYAYIHIPVYLLAWMCTYVDICIHTYTFIYYMWVYLYEHICICIVTIYRSRPLTQRRFYSFWSGTPFCLIYQALWNAAEFPVLALSGYLFTHFCFVGGVGPLVIKLQPSSGACAMLRSWLTEQVSILPCDCFLGSSTGASVLAIILLGVPTYNSMPLKPKPDSNHTGFL